MATGRIIKLPQYRVFVDGKSVGYISYRKPGCKLCLVEPFGPLETAEIEKQVAAKMNTGGTTPLPNVPPELLEPEEEPSFDDFDES